jgi:hypothetical protein
MLRTPFWRQTWTTPSFVHLLDNNIYMVDTLGVEKRLPTKGNYGIYHMRAGFVLLAWMLSKTYLVPPCR